MASQISQMSIFPGFDPKVEQLGRFGDQLKANVSVDSGHLRHQMMAACDLLLMPSRYEPCGLPQMYSQMCHTQSQMFPAQVGCCTFFCLLFCSKIQTLFETEKKRPTFNHRSKVRHSAGGPCHRWIGGFGEGHLHGGGNGHRLFGDSAGWKELSDLSDGRSVSCWKNS